MNLGLTEAEVIQILNSAPAEVEYYLIIEECAERVGEEKLNILMNYVNETLGVGSGTEEPGEDATEEDGTED